MTQSKNYGATQEDWANLQFCLGLGDDMLPVVSNPHAKISPLSKMKAAGKTPSQYNQNRQVAGIAKWTSKVATEAELARWSQEPDYGICIQTRTVRALDIDVTNQEDADAIWKTIQEYFIGGAPTRSRDNSPKRLVAFKILGDIPKRVFKASHGIVEFLATGQQFVACGTHPSGARYEWDRLDSLPTITLEEFDFLWGKLEMLYATEVSKTGNGPRRNDTALAVHDPMMDRLAAAGLILGYGNDGQAFIECPWKHEHSSDSGETEFAYFPKGSRGYTEGNFRCMHASHMDKTNFDFEQALLGIADDFDDLPAVVEEPGALKTVPLASLKHDKKGIEPLLNSVAAVLAAPGTLGYHIVRDVFLDEHMIRPVGGGRVEMIDDLKYVQLRSKLESLRFKEIGREKIRDAVALAGSQNVVDSAQVWLGSLEWDGTPRIEKFFCRYFGGIDTPYTRAVALYIWTALAGRVMEPGIQADMMPVFVGDQGLGKSTVIKLMVPRLELYTELNFHMEEDDMARQMKGKLIAEIPELTGLRTRELEFIKAFISRRVEEWIPKYMEKATFYHRRCLLIGTTNRTDILADSTGNRRFLPVAVGKVDVKALETDCQQLWAEGLVLFRRSGVQWEQAQTLAPEVQQDFQVQDAWADRVDQWLEDIAQEASDEPPVLRTCDILQDAVGIPAGKDKPQDEERVRKIMQTRGWIQKTHYRKSGRKWGWGKK